jgi:PadR family transcriptional regulator, regulatory protein PadR
MPKKDSNPDDSGMNQEKDEKNKFDLKYLHKHERKMIGGFMRGFGKVMILWLISKRRQHGYEIMTQIHEASPYSGKMPSTSMIYPVLHDLEKKGLIKGTWEEQGKRKVKYYEITNEGEESLKRIRKIAADGRKMDNNNLWKKFLEDMFSLKEK